MRKIIPVLSIVFSALCATVAVIGLIMCCAALGVPQFTLVAVPTAIVGTVAASLGAGLNILFRKSRLCRIALFICICALAVSAAAVVIWLVAL